MGVVEVTSCFDIFMPEMNGKSYLFFSSCVEESREALHVSRGPGSNSEGVANRLSV